MRLQIWVKRLLISSTCHCARSWKIAGSIPVVFTGIFHWHIPSGCTMVLWPTQPLTEMSTSNISWGVKVAGAWGWQPYHLHVPIVLKSGSLKLLEPTGPIQACNGIVLLPPLCSLLLSFLSIFSFYIEKVHLFRKSIINPICFFSKIYLCLTINIF